MGLRQGRKLGRRGVPVEVRQGGRQQGRAKAAMARSSTLGVRMDGRCIGVRGTCLRIVMFHGQRFVDMRSCFCRTPRVLDRVGRSGVYSSPLGAGQGACGCQPLCGQGPQQQADDDAAPKRGVHRRESRRTGDMQSLISRMKRIQPTVQCTTTGFCASSAYCSSVSSTSSCVGIFTCQATMCC